MDIEGLKQQERDALIERAKQGEDAAFTTIYHLCKNRTFSLCLRMTGNWQLAEDLTQDAFLQLHRKISTFRGDSQFTTWFHRLTINVVLMHLRKKYLNLVPLEEVITGEEHEFSYTFGKRDPHLEYSIERIAIERAMEALPPGYRLIFVLHDLEGLQHREIAAMLDCSIGNSKSQLHKARVRLRGVLTPD